MSYLVFGLLGVPLLAAFIMLFLKGGTARKFFVYFFAIVIAIGSIVLVSTNLLAIFTEVTIPLDIPFIYLQYTITGISIVAGLVGLFWVVKYKNVIAIILSLVALACSVYFEFFVAPSCEGELHFYINSLTLLMVAIIGVIGSGICIYALGYMEDFSRHLKDGEKDRSNHFFALMFVFLSAMYLIVFSNNMTFMYAGWEVTTLCSFLLIGYTRTDDAIKNSLRQIIMNLLGGIAFVCAMYFTATQMQTLQFNDFISKGILNAGLAALPACLFAFAGITKAAQMPFHTWLLGAMVAPTPTSALLHSSTMVKAGVFMLVKLSPVFFVSLAPQMMVMLVGGVTFLLCSFMAISQTNAKRVLAYSTIANLGLITICAGVGSPEAIWAAMFLILFHACAKSLLFLCVGTAEHHIGSRDIERMDALFMRMPKLARFMIVGMMAMFIAPFGMLISKWAALVSFVDASQIVLILILAFGSAATFMFWAKWIGKLTGIVANVENVEKTVHKSEWISQILMLALTILCLIAMPVLSDYIVMPYICDVYSAFGQNGLYYAISAMNAVPVSNLILTAISTIVMFLVLFVGIGKKNKKKNATIYLAGASLDSDQRLYLGSMKKEMKSESKNWYLDSYFGEAKIAPIGNVLNVIIFIAGLVFAILAMNGII